MKVSGRKIALEVGLGKRLWEGVDGRPGRRSRGCLYRDPEAGVSEEGGAVYAPAWLVLS